MDNIISFFKTNYKKILYLIAGTFFVYAMILICTPKPSMPEDLKSKIDSLTTANILLQQRQKSIDSAILNYETKVKQIDFQLDNIKEKTTIVREYYHEVSQQTSKYTPTQIDSFFKTRYKF